MAAYVLTSKVVLLGTAWTGTAPGAPGTQTVSGTITTASDISQWVRGGGEPGWTTALEDVTDMASGGYVETIPGLTSGDDLVFDCHSDQAAAALDQIIRSTLGGISRAGSSPIYCDIKPASGARSPTNPSSVAAVWIAGWSPYAGAVGERAVARLTLKVTGKSDTLTA